MFSHLLLSQNSTICDAMWVLCGGATGIAIVTDEHQIVQGVVTDGDIRRVLLAGSTLDDSIMPCIKQDFFFVSPQASRAEVIDLMRARLIMQVPILDTEGKILGIHTYHDILGYQKRPHWAVIMAGGKGTRLGTLTESTPKPMIKVAGKPILERIILHLVGFGIENIFLSVNYLSNVVEDYFGDGTRWGCQIKYLKEKAPMGSGGSLSLLPGVPEHSVILMNGDLISEFNVSKMLSFHEEARAYATMAVTEYVHRIPYGCVEVSSSGQVTKIHEKPIIEKKINAGIYILSPEAVQSIPQNTFFPITTLFENALEQNHACCAYDADSDWIDIGTPEDLHRARGAA